MRKMKDSGIEWIGEIPEDWEIKKGKHIFRQRTEKGNKYNLQLLSPTQKYGVIPQTLYEELSGLRAVKLNEETDFNMLKSIYKGDFCISLRSFQGGFEYSDYNGVVSPAYQVFYSMIEIVDGYYKYLFKCNEFISKMNSYTLSLRDGKNIAFSDFGSSFIPYPPIEEQRKIVDRLTMKIIEIDKSITDTKATIEDYRKYKRAVITETVTKGLDDTVPMKDSGIDWIGQIPKRWEVRKIKKVCKLQTGTTPPTEKQEYFNGEIEWYTPVDFNDGYVLKKSRRTLSIIAREENKSIIVPKESVMIIGIGGTAGKIGYCTKECSCNQQITAMIPSDIFGKYLMYYMVANTKRIKETALFTTLPILNNETIGNYLIIVPFDIEEQEQIAEYLDKKVGEIDSLIASKEALVAELEAYKKSVIYEYVTGKKEVV